MELNLHSLDKGKESEAMDIVIYDLPLVVGLISLTVVIVKVLAYKSSKQGEWSVKVVGAQAPKTDQNLVGVTNTVMDTNSHSLHKQTKEKWNG